MDRNQRFEFLAQGDADRIIPLAEEVLGDVAVTIVTPPRVGTLMLRLREPVAGTVFNAGEVLVSEARVAIGEAEGYAMRLGRDPEATLAAAILDAAVAAGHDLTPRIETLLAELAATGREHATAAWREVAATRVVFDEMR